MSASARQSARLLLALAILTMGMSSEGEARHWRYYGHYGRNFDRGAGESREREPTASVPDKPSGGETAGFGAAIAQMIRACGEQAAELKRMPLDVVSQTVQPNEDQGRALEQIRDAANGAAETLAAACPKDIPGELAERFDTLNQALDAIAAALATLRPPFVAFYGSLDDEQKARLVLRLAADDSRPNSDRETRLAGNQPNTANGANAPQEPGCRRWAANLRSWPIRQIESGMQLSDEQHAALYDLTAAIYRAAASLAESCPDQGRFTPLGRLDAKENQLQALRQGIDAIRPALGAFENDLNDAQKSRLDALVNTAQQADERMPR